MKMGVHMGKTVLVADDEKFIRDILKLHLENSGYNVMLSENGEEAIKVLRSYNVSVAVMDIKMPKVDGFGVLDFVKRHCRNVPVIMLTGYVDVDTAVEAMKRGSIDFLTKPIKKDRLLDAVDYALKAMDSTDSNEPFVPKEIFLLRDDGIVIYHENLAPSSTIDSDLFGSMFAAIKMFVKDSFSQSDDGLRTIEHGRFKILIEEGSKFFLVIVGQGDDIDPMREKMRAITDAIKERYGGMLSDRTGNIDIFKGIEREFEVFSDLQSLT
jgi:CheY-like chemotaxis protein